MGKATVYCEKCGNVISEDDFTKGKAVFFENANYCSKCKKEIEHLLNLPPVEEKEPPAKSPGSSSVLRKAVSSQIPSKQILPRPLSSKGIPAPKPIKSDTTKYHKKESTGVYTKPSSKNIYIYGIIGFIILVVIIFLIIPKPSKNEDSSTIGSSQNESDKKDYGKMVDNFSSVFENAKLEKNDPRKQFQMLSNLITDMRKVSSKISSTQYYSKFQTILTEAEDLKNTLDRQVPFIEELEKKLAEQSERDKRFEYLQQLKDNYSDEIIKQIFAKNTKLQNVYVNKIHEKITKVERSIIEFELDNIDKLAKEDILNFDAIERIFEDLVAIGTTRKELLNKYSDLKQKFEERKKEIEKKWLEIGEKNYAELEKQVDNLCEQKKFDEVEKLIIEFQRDRKKWCCTPISDKATDLLIKLGEIRYEKGSSSESSSTEYKSTDFVKSALENLTYSFENNVAIFSDSKSFDLINSNETVNFDGLLFFEKSFGEELDVEFEFQADKGYVGIFLKCAPSEGGLRKAGGFLLGTFKDNPSSRLKFEYGVWYKMRVTVKNEKCIANFGNITIYNRSIESNAPEKGSLALSIKGGTLKLRNFKIYK